MEHKQLDVWNAAVDFVVEVYEATKDFPKEELYGLTNQVRRAVVSVPSNIAEGAGRNSSKEFTQFLHIALVLWDRVFLDTKLGVERLPMR